MHPSHMILVKGDRASVDAAYAAMQAERRKVEQATGLKIANDGTIRLPRVHIIHCYAPGCTFAATAQRQGQAIKSVSAHYLRTHMSAGE
jgi:hypothetical protein